MVSAREGYERLAMAIEGVLPRLQRKNDAYTLPGMWLRNLIMLAVAWKSSPRLLLWLLVEQAIVAKVNRAAGHELSDRVEGALKALRAGLGDPGTVQLEWREALSPAIALERVEREGRECLLPRSLLLAGEGQSQSQSQSKGEKASQSKGERNAGPPPALQWLQEAWRTHLAALQPSSCHAQWYRQGVGVVTLLLPVLAWLLPAPLWLPSLLLLTSPLLPLLVHGYQAARLEIITNLLLQSTAPYEGLGVEDEFDEVAPPPMKALVISPLSVLGLLLSRLLSSQGSLFWSHSLTGWLATGSVMLYLDREGLLTLPYQLPERMTTFAAVGDCKDKGGGEREREVRDRESRESRERGGGGEQKALEVKVETEVYVDLTNPSHLLLHLPPEGNLNDLRALGMAMLLTTGCGVQQGHYRAHWHRRYGLGEQTRPGGSLETCHCLLARQMGYMARQAAQWHKEAELWLQDGGLYARIVSSRGGDWQLMAVGEVGTILGHCEFYWNGVDLVRLEPSTRQGLLEEASLLAKQDLHALAYAYRPLPNEATRAPFAASKRGGCLRLGSEQASPLLSPLILLGTLNSSYQDKDVFPSLMALGCARVCG